MELVRLLMADFTMAFMWVSLNATLRVLVDRVAQYIGLYDDATQFLKRSAVVGLLFVFYWLSKVTGGASYNPVTVIAYVAAKITDSPLYTLIFRVPAQVLGAIAGVSTAVTCMPDAYRPMLTGPYLQVDPHIGALAEGVLTFAVVFIVLVANVRGPKSGIQKTWITSISRVSLSTFGAQYTGPAMNPANAFGWAFLRDQHNSWEHVYVYWVTPILATLVAAWMVRHVVIPTRKLKEKRS